MSASFSDHMSNTSPHGRRIDILSILSFKLNHCSILTFLSSYHLAMNLSNRPTKRRRTKAVRRVTEGDDTLADGVIVKRTIKETVRGPVEERIEVPIHCNPSHPTNTADSQSVPLSTQSSQIPTEGFGADSSEFFHPISPNDETPQVRRTQAYYLQQFVDCVHPTLKALLSREVIPNMTMCGRCEDGKIAVWRCRDCTAARYLCRACIRDCHMDCPTHRIEGWSGHYFRRAELWEVGLYILVRHHKDPHLCP